MRGLGLVMAALLAAIPVFAQQAQNRTLVENSPILILDQLRLYEQSEFGRRVSAMAQAQAEALGAENQRIDAALEAEERRLTEDRPNMDPAEFRKLAIDFDERVTEIRRAQVAKQAAITQKEDQERARFFELVFPVLFSLVQETGAVAILNAGAIVFTVRNIDITDEAIARVNEEIGASPLAQDTGPQPLPRPQSQP